MQRSTRFPSSQLDSKLLIRGEGGGDGGTYEIYRYTKCSEDRLLCKKALHVRGRKRVSLWGRHIIPACTWLYLIMVDLEGACGLAFWAHFTTDVPRGLCLMLDE